MSKTTILELTTASVVSETEDFIPMVDVSDTTESNDGTTKRATVRKLLKDKALPSGDIVGTSDVQTLEGKTLAAPVITDADITGGSVSATTNVVEVLKKVYPVGCIYTSTVSANPNIVFGFGTWASFGAGKTLVGLDSGDGDFDEAEKTGGAKTHTLTTAEMPEHTHTQDAHGHSIITDPASSPSEIGAVDAGGGRFGSSDTVATAARLLKAANTTATNQNTGGDGAHNNLQPYIVVYFWKRES